MAKKDGDVAAEMLCTYLSEVSLPYFTVGVTADSLLIYTNKPEAFKGKAPKTCGGWKVKITKTSQPRPAV